VLYQLSFVIVVEGEGTSIASYTLVDWINPFSRRLLISSELLLLVKLVGHAI
jgi:hypothetical protein